MIESCLKVIYVSSDQLHEISIAMHDFSDSLEKETLTKWEGILRGIWYNVNRRRRKSNERHVHKNINDALEASYGVRLNNDCSGQYVL